MAIMHMERYYYPKKDEKGNVVRMEPTWKKEAAKFYCIRKTCILQRHPYFWKGMLHVDDSIAARLKDAHRNLLEQEFHFIC
jgi:hypothetical protein